MNHSRKNHTGSEKLPGGTGRVRNLAKAFVKLGVSSAALWYVFSRIDLAGVLDIFLSANHLLLALALVCFALSKLCSALRLNLFFRSIGVRLTGASNARLYLLGMFYNLFMPGGIGGDGYKVYLLRQRKEAGVKRLIWVVFLDRLTGMLALMLIALITGGFIPEFEIYRYLSFILALTGILVLALLVRLYLGEFVRIMPRVAGYSLAVQFLQLVSVAVILLALGVGGNYIHYLFIFFVSSVVSIIPLTIGGAGAREITFLYGAGFFGLDAGLSITVSLTFYIITVITSLAGLYYVVHPVRLKPEAGHLPVSD